MLIPKTHCPKCRVQFTSDPGFPVGRTIQCPKCNIGFTVQGPAPAAVPPPAPARAVAAPPPKPAPAPVRAAPVPPPRPTPAPARAPVPTPAPVRAAPSLPPKPTPVPARAAPKPPPIPKPPPVVASRPRPVKPRPADPALAEATPRSSLFPLILLGLMVVTGGVGYLVYELKAKERAGSVARVSPPTAPPAPAPAPEVAPEPVVPVAPVTPVPPPVRKDDVPGSSAAVPAGKPSDVGAPPMPPPPVTPKSPPPAPPVVPPPPPKPEPEPVAVAPPPRPIVPPAPAPAGSIPRRMLFVHATKYLYLNPLTGAPAGGADRTRAAASTLAERWDVPTGGENNQLFLLSDTLPPPDGRHLVKGVLEATVRKFFETSRGQDRVVVYFGGHVLERDKKAYLAPVEGDPDDLTTLIPLDEFYAGMAACPAGQKVVVWDVCRYNPQRGRRRPGSEPMSGPLYAALTAAPPGVEVVVTCRPGENALEFFTAPTGAKGATYSGSLFLEAFRSVEVRRPKGAKPVPTDPIPLAEWTNDLLLRVGELAKLAPAGGAAQTLGVAGRARADPVRYDPAEPIAARFDLPNVAGAPADEVGALVREFAVPPLRAGAGDASAADAPYQADTLKDYAPDVTIEEILANKEKYAFRVAVIEALDEVRSIWKTGAGSLRMRDSCPAPVTEALKKQFKADQDAWALGIARLEVLSLRLDELSKERAAQPPRWQAHHDYARAVLRVRLAYMQEYNLAVGNVITETLPDLDPKKDHDAYALASLATAEMKSKKAVKQLAAEAAELFEKLAKERKGTPWAVQAQWDRTVPLGLAWQPVSTKGPPPTP